MRRQSLSGDHRQVGPARTDRRSAWHALLARFGKELPARWRYPVGCLFAATLLATTGCSTVYERQLRFSDGWREGDVLEVGSASTIKSPQFSDCREATISPQAAANGKFVLVAFRYMSRIERRVVPLPIESNFATGEMVYVNVADCSLPLMPRFRGWRVSR